MKAAGALLLERENEVAKIRVAEVGLLRSKTAAARINPKKTEANGHEIKTGNGSEEAALPRHPAEAAAPSANGSARPSVSPQLFDLLTRAAIQAMGPMADIVLRAHISALGESRDAFPQVKLGRLIDSVSTEILNQTMRAHFQDAMHREMAVLKFL